MGNAAFALKRDDTCDVVPFVSREAATRQRIEAVLATLAPDLKHEAIQAGATHIVRAMKPGARGMRAAGGPYAWQSPVGSRARLAEYGRAGLSKASAMGVPAEWLRAVLLECAAAFGCQQPTRDQMQRASLFLHDRTGGRYTPPDRMWLAYAILTEGARLSGERLTVFESGGRPKGTALTYVRDMHRAIGRGPAIVARWPVEYREANRILATWLPGEPTKHVSETRIRARYRIQLPSPRATRAAIETDEATVG